MDPLFQEALDRFETLYKRAVSLEVEAPSVMALATSDAKGNPSVRMVNLRQRDEHGFVFFTNQESGKIQQLVEIPRAAMCFYWHRLAEQVVIKGNVQLLSDEQSDDLWHARSHEQNVASCVSHMSEPLTNPDELKERIKKVRAEYPDGRIPPPPHWAGYRLKPDHIVFWRANWRDLQGRVAFQLEETGWTRELLTP